jgi:hypothetical protein
MAFPRGYRSAEGDTLALINVGKNPRGVVVNNADTRAYVMNYISKDVSVIDLTVSPELELARVSSADLPAAGSDAAKFLLGNELFNSSRGTFDEGVAERMSSELASLRSCHQMARAMVSSGRLHKPARLFRSITHSVQSDG